MGAHRLRVAEPPLMATGRFPKFIRRRRIPARRMDSVRDITNRNFFFRESRKQVPKEVSTHNAVELAYAIDKAAASDCEIRHIEVIAGVQLSQRDKPLERDPELFA